MISAIDRDVRAVLNRTPTQGSSVFRIVHLLACSLNLEPARAAAAIAITEGAPGAMNPKSWISHLAKFGEDPLPSDARVRSSV
jgi:hypothetical protein